MENVITLVVCFGLVLLLLGVLISMIRVLFSFGKDHVRATVQYVSKPGADEV